MGHSRNSRRPQLLGACATSLIGAMLLAAPTALAQSAKVKLDPETAAWGTAKEESASAVAPSAALAAIKAKLDKDIAALSAAVDAEAARLATFTEKADVAKDKAMEKVGMDSKKKLEGIVVKLLKDADAATPKGSALKPTWDSAGANECSQIAGADGTKKGSATCGTNGEVGSRTAARAQGDGAAANATAAHAGAARARAQGNGSKATAKGGDAGRTNQAGNVADAVSTGGSETTANAGLGDFDEGNRALAVAADGSRSSVDAHTGDQNRMFAGAFNKGAAIASNRAGDRNVAIAVGANGNNAGAAGGNPQALNSLGARAGTLMGFDNIALSVADGANSTAYTNAGYGDRHKSVAASGPNSHARADSAQGQDSYAFAQATDRSHALAFNSYGDQLNAIAKAKGDGSAGRCSPLGGGGGSGETALPPNECATANARAVDGIGNFAISISDKAKSNAVAERGGYNTAVAKALNGGTIIWNVATPGQNQPANPQAGMKPECPWQAQGGGGQPQPPCGNATAKASYGDGNLAVALPNGDHTFTWAESSGGSYNQTLATADGSNSKARARSIYNAYGTAKAIAADGGSADVQAGTGYQNVALGTARGKDSVATVNVYGAHSRATAVASAGGKATAVHSTTFLPGNMASNKVECSDNAVSYAMIGTGQSCGKGF